ncbi:GNAT family N-acetyltransferase, partial [Salmonella enterica subsp. enterica serovar Kentucky]|nr:GNAT family N-acetyltransferase [Salmonella enterica subsp. enterica serovar Kentucky]
LGRRLMEKLIAYTRDHGLKRLNGITMPNNRGMVALARKLGFQRLKASVVIRLNTRISLTG